MIQNSRFPTCLVVLNRFNNSIKHKSKCVKCKSAKKRKFSIKLNLIM